MSESIRTYFDPQSLMRSGRWSSIIDFTKYVVERFFADRCTSVAASLSFTSMISAVPLFTIAFALFAAFPIFEDMREQLLGYVFDNFIPSAGNVVREQLDTFSANASQTSAIGAIVLIVTTILTLTTIERAYNLIWRIEEERPLFQRLILYWTFMTMGPILMGASLSVSSYVFAMRTYFLDADAAAAGFGFISFFIPFMLASLVFILGYKIIPNREIQWRHAIIGGLVAGALFDTLKNAFGWYVSNFPSYQAVYGAMAVLPLFMIWLNLVWTAVLIGAEITAALPEWAAIRRKGANKELPAAQQMVLFLRVLKQFQSSATQGSFVRDRDVQEAAGDLVAGVQHTLSDLRRLNYVAPDGEGTWRLCRDLDEVPLHQLIDDLGYGVPEIEPQAGNSFPNLQNFVDRVRGHMATEGGMSVKAFLKQMT